MNYEGSAPNLIRQVTLKLYLYDLTQTVRIITHIGPEIILSCKRKCTITCKKGKYTIICRISLRVLYIYNVNQTPPPENENHLQTFIRKFPQVKDDPTHGRKYLWRCYQIDQTVVQNNFLPWTIFINCLDL